MSGRDLSDTGSQSNRKHEHSLQRLKTRVKGFLQRPIRRHKTGRSPSEAFRRRRASTFRENTRLLEDVRQADTEPQSPNQNGRNQSTQADTGIGESEGGSGPSNANTAPSPQQSDAERQVEGSNTTDEPPPSTDLWVEAYEKVEEDKVYGKLISKLEDYLKTGKISEEKTPGLSGTLSPVSRLQAIRAIAKEKLDGLEQNAWRLKAGNTEIVAREATLKAIGVIMKFKDVINAAISAQPYAALAWAGVMVFLPFLDTTLQQSGEAAEGLRQIVFHLVRWRKLEEAVLVELKNDGLPDTTHGILQQTRANLIEVYSKVYIYEISFVLQRSRGRFSRLARDALGSDEWKKKWTDIDSIGRKIDAGLGSLVSTKVMEVSKDMDTIKDMQKAMLECLEHGERRNLLKELPCKENAIFDSAAISKAETKCLDETRLDVLDEIQKWAENPEAKRILWLNGMAGTGKTSVALSVASALQNGEALTSRSDPPNDALLGATFFFKKRDMSRNSTDYFFTTVAAQLANKFPAIQRRVAKAIDDNSHIGSKAPSQQLNHLINRPLLELDREGFTPIRLVVVVDALDECEVHRQAEDLVGMLEHLQKLSTIQLRFLITSRRDEHISRSFGRLEHVEYRDFVLGKIPPHPRDLEEMDDITRYLRHELAMLANRYGVSHDWISTDRITELNRKSDGLFIYAATICRFMDHIDFNQNGRLERLEIILGGEIGPNAPQQKIDEIYLAVLSFPEYANSLLRTKTGFHNRISRILGFLVLLFEPVSGPSLAQLLSQDKASLDKDMQSLHAVMNIPGEQDAPLGLVHLSFRDFLLSNERSKSLEFRIEEPVIHQDVLERCLQLMSEGLEQDMCKLIQPGKPVCEVPKGRIEERLPGFLRYACRYWVDHLAELDPEKQREAGLGDGGKVYRFLEDNALFWMEAMSLMGDTQTMVLRVNRLATLSEATKGKSPNLARFVYEIRRFALDNRWVIEHFPRQIYVSGLVFCAAGSKMRSQFGGLIPSWLTQTPKIVENAFSPAITLEKEKDFWPSVAFSPAEDLIASGSRGLVGGAKSRLRIWDYITGTELYKFDHFNDDKEESSPSKSILCLAFSPDGRTIACGMSHGPVQLIRFSEGRTLEITSSNSAEYLAFPAKNSTILAYLSEDKGVIICDTVKRCIIQTISLDVDPTRGFAFSPSGDFLALGRENLVELFGVEKGELRRTWGPGGDILSVAVSMDGKTVVLGTYHTIASWDVATGQKIQYHKGSWTPNCFVFLKERMVAVDVDGDDTSRNVRLIDTITGRQTECSVPASDLRFGALSSRDGTFLTGARVYSGGIQLWDISKPAGASNHYTRSSTCDFIDFLPGDPNFVLCRYSQDWAFWDVRTGSRDTLRGFDWDLLRKVGHVDFYPKEKVAFLVNRWDGLQSELWDWSMRNCVAKGLVPKLASSKDGSYLAWYDGEVVRIFHTETALREAAKFEIIGCHDFGFVSGGNLFYWATTDEFVLCDFAEKKEVVARPLGRLRFRTRDDVNASPDGSIITLVVRDAEGADNLLVYELAAKRERWISPWSHNACKLEEDEMAGYWIKFDPQSSVIAISSANGSGCSSLPILVYDTSSWRRVATLGEMGVNYEEITNMAISASGKVVALYKSVLWQDEIIRIWDIKTEKEILWREGNIHAATRNFSCSGDYLEFENGRLPLSAPADFDAGSPKQMESCLRVENEWIFQGYDQIMWLPPSYRRLPFAWHGETLAMGGDDGHVIFFTFDLARIPLSHPVSLSL